MYRASRRGRDGSVDIATRYGLDDPRIESRWGARFSAPVQTGPGAYPASYKMGTGFFQRVKRPGRGVDHPPPSRAEVKERVELYLYFPSWTFVACSRVNITFTFTFYRASCTVYYPDQQIHNINIFFNATASSIPEDGAVAMKHVAVFTIYKVLLI